MDGCCFTRGEIMKKILIILVLLIAIPAFAGWEIKVVERVDEEGNAVVIPNVDPADKTVIATYCDADNICFTYADRVSDKTMDAFKAKIEKLKDEYIAKKKSEPKVEAVKPVVEPVVPKKPTANDVFSSALQTKMNTKE
jgi:uncharacterized protein YxeA